MGKYLRIIIIAIIFILVNSKGFSQNSKLDLDKIYLNYLKSNSDTSDIKIIDYLVKQYHVLENIEKQYFENANSSFKTKIPEIELIAYKFLENMEKIKKTYKNEPSNLSKAKFNQVIYLNGLLANNYEIFSRIVNDAENKKELISKFRKNNLICREQLIQLLQ